MTQQTTLMTTELAAIPSPPTSAIELGPFTIHFYALCILAGIIVAVWWGERRWVAMGGQSGTILDAAAPAVILGIIGGRLYHVISDYQLYFLADSPNEPWQAIAIWDGGLGIWGAIPMGALGVWLVARYKGISLSQLSFAVAPGIAVAQGIGRWGNYFNQELFGAPTEVPWALQVDPGVLTLHGLDPAQTTYHPTFLYESLWCFALAGLLVWLGRSYPQVMAGGRLFAVYVMGYCVGRFWIEYLRIDPANEILGLRLNNWTTLLVFAGALAYFVWAGRRMDALAGTTVAAPAPSPAPSPATVGAADSDADPDPVQVATEPSTAEPSTAEPSVGEPSVGETADDEHESREVDDATAPDTSVGDEPGDDSGADDSDATGPQR